VSNQFSPFGFRDYYAGSGGAGTYAQHAYKIASGNGTAIYRGDPVMPVLAATGYITQGAAGTTVLAGIFEGCKYLSTGQKRTIWMNYWPGSDATNDVEAYVFDDPNAQFLVQGNSTTFNITGTLAAQTSGPQMQYAQFAIGTGNSSTQQSGAYLNSLGTTVTYPFIVRDLYVDPPGANGTDPTTANNYVIVGFNNEIMRTNGAGPVGIS
jgi:hypothetical protein